MTQELNALTVALNGINLIEASAGTGKTYTITTLFLRLILEKKLSIEKILVVTFTEAATEELRDRLRRRLQEAFIAFQHQHSDDLVLTTLLKRQQDNDTYADALERLKMAIRGFDEASVFTIHSFCRQMLRDNAFESGVLFDTELITDTQHFLRTIVEDFWRQHLYDAPPMFIHWLLDHSLSNPEKLLAQVGGGRFIGQPLLTIDPSEIPQPDIIKAVIPFTHALQSAKAEWLHSHETVCDYLMSSPDLKHKTYSKRYVPLWQKKTTLFFTTAHEYTLSLADEVKRFAASSVSEHLNDGKTLKQFALLEKMEALLSAYQALDENYQSYLLFLKIKLFHTAAAQLEHKKHLHNVQSFDDLLLNLHKALMQPSGNHLAKTLQNKFKAALIDEFQDTDPMQYEIFHKIYAPKADQEKQPLLFMIGDPKQAIYSFRGADIFAYLKASRAAGERRYTLPINYRSDAPLIQAVNALFSHNENPFLFKDIAFNPVKAPAEKPQDIGQFQVAGHYPEPLLCWFVDSDAKQEKRNKGWAKSTIPQAIGYEIAQLLNLAQQNLANVENRPLVAGDIAILVRTNNQAQIMQQTLNAQQIPSVIYSHESLFTAPETAEIERILLAIADPSQERQVKAALTTDLLGLNGTQLFELTSHDTEWQRYLKRFQQYHERWQKQGFIQMYRYLLVTEQIPERLLSYTNGERRLTNILHAGELLQQAAVSEKLGVNALCQWLNRQRQEADTASKNEAAQLRLESDDKRVKIITIHKSKGLEYPIVFCPFLWDGALRTKNANIFAFHDADERLILDIGSKEQETHREQALREERAESLRLLYVAITRAKHRCYIVWGNIKDIEHSALAHLLYPNLAAENLIKASDELLTEPLTLLNKKTQGTFNFQALPLKPIIYQRPPEAEVCLTARTFRGHIARDWRISSFSALTRHHESNDRLIDLPDHDETSEIELSTVSLNNTQANIFDFPRGKRAGDFMHILLQYLDFTAPLDEQIIATRLQAFGYNAEQWLTVITTLLNDVLNTPLDSAQPHFTLSQLKRTQRLNELEFYYPVANISAEGLKQHLLPIAKAIGSPLPERLERLQFSPLQGFMKGFIDLVFQYEGRFYLVDYKSNYLGRHTQAYHHSNLPQAMARHDYFLQYCLYTVALHRYLSIRLPNYDYTQHFGGVYYLFLRGMRPAWGAGYGIFYDKPNAEWVEQLSGYLGMRI